MQSKSSPRKFYYKCARFLNPTESLQKLLDEVWRVRPKPAQRTQRLALREEDENEITVFYRATHQEMACGILHHCRPGDPAIAMIMKDDADNYEIRQIAPQTKPGERVEFAKHLIHFCARGNHVIIVASQGVGTEELEDHLNWLLKSFVAKFGKENHLTLSDPLPAEIATQPIVKAKSIVIMSEPLPSVDRTSLPDVGRLDVSHGDKNADLSTEAAGVTFVFRDDPLMDAIVALLRKKGASEPESLLKVSDAIEKGNLRAKVELIYSGKNKEKSPVVDDVATVLRHTPGVDFKITLPNKRTINSADYKISKSFSVRKVGGLPETADVFKKMAKMLADLVENKEVVANP